MFYAVTFVPQPDAAAILAEVAGIRVYGPFDNREQADAWRRDEPRGPGVYGTTEVLPISAAEAREVVEDTAEKCVHCGGPIAMRYPGNDPENGPARPLCPNGHDPKGRVVEMEGSLKMSSGAQARLLQSLQSQPGLSDDEVRRVVYAFAGEFRVDDYFTHDPDPAYEGTAVVREADSLVVARCETNMGDDRASCQEMAWAIANVGRVLRYMQLEA